MITAKMTKKTYDAERQTLTFKEFKGRYGWIVRPVSAGEDKDNLFENTRLVNIEGIIYYLFFPKGSSAIVALADGSWHNHKFIRVEDEEITIKIN